MHLYLTNISHLNSAYVNNSGQVIYKVETPNKFFHRVSAIKRVLPGNLHASESSEASTSNRRSSGELEEATISNDDDPVKSDVEDDEVSDEHVDEEDDIQEPEGGNMPDVKCHRFGDFGHLAEITFDRITPAILRFGGQEHESTKLFTKKKFGRYIRNRAFTGPDGIEYEWTARRMVSELVRVDSGERDKKTLIARFNRRRIFTKPRPASLEIFSEGMHMVDLIFITFVYFQKLRNDKKKSPHEN